MPSSTSNGRAPENGTSKPHSWYDQDAEQQLLVELIIYPHYLSEITSIVRPDDLSPPGGNQYQALVELIERDGRTSAHLLACHPLVDNSDLAKQLEQRTPIGAPRPYAKHLAVLARRRRAAYTAEELKRVALAGDDQAIDNWIANIDLDLRAVGGAPAALIDVDELLAEDDPDYDWLIPGLLERGDRLIVTAAEGDGKSTLLRQIAMRCTSGEHPFTGDPIDPLRILYVDCENSRRHVRRQIGKLRVTAGDNYEPGHLQLEFRPNGVDLLDPIDVAWLNSLVDTAEPQLVMIGPLYKMAAGDPVKEETARDVSSVIDHIRARTGAAFIIEAHTPYADGSKSKRPTRPYGASLWSRWPEFGICLTKTGVLEHWRGPRDERAWPAALERSTPWPWAPRDDIDTEWQGPTDCMAIVRRLFTDTPDLELGKSAVPVQVKALYGSSFRRDTIYQSLERLVLDEVLIARTGPRNGRYYRLAAHAPDADTEMF